MKKFLVPALCAILPAFAHASLVADGGTETLLDDGAEAVHKFTQGGTFTLFADSTARLLVVGGGGGGDCSGAGGYANTVSCAVDGTNVVEAVPLASVTDAGRALGAMVLEESVGKIRLSVDVASMRHASKSAKQHFVLRKNGIDTEHVELVQGKGYTLSWTYGWPSTLSAPENEGDLPTGVWADVPATACTIIMVK